MDYGVFDMGGEPTDDIDYENINHLISIDRQVLHVYKNYFISNSYTIFEVSFLDMKRFFNNEIDLNYLLDKNEYIYFYKKNHNTIYKRKYIENGTKIVKYSDDGYQGTFQYEIDNNFYTETYIKKLKNYANINLRKEKIRKLLYEKK